MPITELTERDHLTIELAIVIEDPAGIEALDLAAVILEIFARRSPRQCEVMRQSLWRWAQQFPRSLAAVDAAQSCPQPCPEASPAPATQPSPGQRPSGGK